MVVTAVHCSIFAVWNQKAGVLFPLTIDGMNGTAKSAPKREPVHASGSALWQSALTVAYSILTCENCSRK